jgi:capsular polysaccharide biosynthesis protein
VGYVEWGHDNHGNYFHWIYDVLPRLLLLRDNITFDKIYVNQEKAFQRELLSLLGYGVESVLPAEQFPWLIAETIFTTKYLDSFNTLSPQLVLQVRDVLVNALNNSRATTNSTKPRRIYLSRCESTSRRLENEVEVVEYLRNLGFEKIIPEKLSVAQQIQLFQDAECIVGPHGAAMTNLTFCRKSCKVVELFPKEYKIDLYRTIAESVGADYHAVGGNNMNSMQDYWDSQHSDFHFDLDTLNQYL